jgi:hypothetical protein
MAIVCQGITVANWPITMVVKMLPHFIFRWQIPSLAVAKFSNAGIGHTQI